MSHFFMRSRGNYTPPCPDPHRFDILEGRSFDNIHTMVVINYPGCDQYKGNKIAIYKKTPQELRKLKFLDPHFLEREDMVSPIARFPASEEGVDNAIMFLKALMYGVVQ